MKTKILIAEDDDQIRELIKEVLEAHDYEITAAEDGLMALDCFQKDSFDLVILDIMMPKIDGFVVCEMIRKTSDVPILFLTALEEEEDQLKGYNLNIDDYMTKPFSIHVLIKKVEAILRRTKVIPTTKRLRFKDIVVDQDAYKVFVQGEEVVLTAKEFEILVFFMENMGRVINRERLLNELWGYDFYGDERVIDTHIKNLRHKLNLDCIKTIRGVGYKFEKE